MKIKIWSYIRLGSINYVKVIYFEMLKYILVGLILLYKTMEYQKIFLIFPNALCTRVDHFLWGGKSSMNQLNCNGIKLPLLLVEVKVQTPINKNVLKMYYLSI